MAASIGRQPMTLRIERSGVSTEKEQKPHDVLARHLPAAARAWADGLKATKTAWNQQSHQFEDTGLPDHKIRAECAEKIWHNVVGRPIERSMQVTGNYKELSELVDELKQSPEAQRLIAAGFFQSLLSTAPENETKPDPEQKTG
jgi:hypothetical protein